MRMSQKPRDIQVSALPTGLRFCRGAAPGTEVCSCALGMSRNFHSDILGYGREAVSESYLYPGLCSDAGPWPQS